MKKLVVALLLLFFSSKYGSAQFNYIAANVQNIAGIYTDLGTSGTKITQNIEGLPFGQYGDNSSIQDIGFNFNYNGKIFTQFVLNSHGFIKLGINAYASGNTPVLESPDTNIIAAFNYNFENDVPGSEYRVHRSGIAGSRVCTVQFKNLREFSNQYNAINFQIKLYEGSNNIEFVYGDFTPGAAAAFDLGAGCCIKGSINPLSVAIIKQPFSYPWSSAYSINSGTSAYLLYNRNDFLPVPGTTFRFVADPANPLTVNDAKVDAIYTLGTMPSPCGQPHIIKARITNTGGLPLTDLPVALSVYYSNQVRDTQYVTLAPQASVVVSFDPVSFVEGFNGIVVSIPDDAVMTNNSITLDQVVNKNTFNYSYNANTSSPFGTGMNEGMTLVKYHLYCTDTVKKVNVTLSGQTSLIGKTVYAVLLDAAGNIKAQSDPLILTLADIYSKQFTLNNPPGLTNTDFYVGLAQTSSTTAYYPVATQTEAPGRPDAFYTLQGLTGGIPVETNSNGIFRISAVLTEHYDKFDYFAADAQNVTGTYTDLAASGTAITTNYAGAAMTFDDDNSAVQNIGFNFRYNGTAFTQFVLNTNGFIKLGNTPSLINNFDVLNSADINTIAPFNCDLVAGTGTPEFRVLTSGIAGSRVCTIQFKRLRDKPPSQYNFINFQIKLYEGSNNIEFVYGNFNASAAAALTLPVVVGLKGWDALNSVNALKMAAVPWASASFIDGSYPANTFENNNSVLPNSGRTFRFVVINDAKVDAVYTFGKIPSPVAVFNHVVRTKIINTGSVFLTALPITLNISGANTFSNTKTIVLAPKDSMIVDFDPVSLWNLGTNLLTVTVPSDDNNTNNSSAYTQIVNSDTVAYADNSPVAGSIGFGSGEGLLLVKLPAGGIITKLRVHISNEAANIGNIIHAVATDEYSLLSESAPYTISPADLGNYVTLAFIDTVLSIFSGYRYIGIRQTANPGNPYYPLSYQMEGTSAARPGTYFTAPTDISSLTEVTDSGRFMIEAVMGIDYEAPAFNIGTPSHMLAAWDFTGSNSPVSLAATISDTIFTTVPLLTRGPGAPPHPAPNQFSTSGFRNDGIAMTNTDYFQFSLTTKPGDTLKLTGISYRTHGKYFIDGNYGGSQFAYSFDGINFTPFYNIPSEPELQTILPGSTVTFRFYATNIQDTGDYGFISVSPGDYGLTIFGKLISSNKLLIAPLAPTGANFSLPDCNTGATGSISFITRGNFGANNKYYLQLGSFVIFQGVSRQFIGPFTLIDSIVSNANSGIFNFTIPPYARGNMLRMISTDPYIEGDRFSNEFNISGPACGFTSTAGYFRSKASGNWTNLNIWEYESPIGWVQATSVPDINARQVLISHDDTVTISSNVSATELLVNGKLKLINDGVTNKGSLYVNQWYRLFRFMFIDTSGIFQVISSNAVFEDVMLNPEAEIKIAGKIIVGDGNAATAAGFDNFGISPSFYYYNGSVLEWNSNNGIQPRTDTLYFPNVIRDPDNNTSVVALRSPMLRLTKIPNSNLGGTDSTTINGLLEVNTPVTWNGSGKKTFKDGIQGSSTVTQAPGSGEFVTTSGFQSFPPSDSTVAALKGVINGTVSINLNSSTGYTLLEGATIPDTANVRISGQTRSYEKIELQPGGRMTIDPASELDIQNADLINRGILLGPGTVKFSGNIPSFINSPGIITAPILLENKELFLAGNTRTDSIALKFHSHMNLDSFHLYTGSANLLADSVNFFVTNDTGRLMRNVSSANPVTFPIGVDTSSYNPVTITNPGSTDNFQVRVDSVISPRVIPAATGNVKRTWYINDSAQTSSNLTVQVQWNAADEQANFERSISFLSQSQICQPPPNCTDNYYDVIARTPASGSGPYTQTRSSISNPSNFIVKSSADTLTFTGNAANGNWNDPNNWTIGIVPSLTIGMGQVIVINYTNGIPPEVNGDIIVQPGGSLIISPGKLLNVNGQIIVQ